MFLTGLLGFALTLPIALLAACQARMLPWWPAVAMFAGQVAAEGIPNGVGLIVWAGTLVALSYALWRWFPDAESRGHEPSAA